MVITFNAPKMLFPVPSWLVSSTPHLRLLNTVGLDRLGVGHLSVLLFCLGCLALCLGLGLALLALNLGLLLGVLLLVLLHDRLALALDLVVVALDDGAGNGTDVIPLGDVLGLGGVLTLVVQPVLERVSYIRSGRSLRLTSMVSSLAESLDFSSSLANSA
jgi:hypothetical protein